MEWKKARATWKFQKLRQVWLINHMYDDKQVPDSHWNLFLEYIHDLKGAARNVRYFFQDALRILLCAAVTFFS